MLKEIRNNKLRFLFIFLSLIGLVCVRFFEDVLFYDPFLNYFKTDYYNLSLPEIDNLQLFFGLFFRYFLNTSLSLAIIYVLFKDIDAVKFASVLYLIFFVILVVIFFFVLFYFGETNKMSLFYLRRFIIQPIFLLLFLPAFYYQKQN